MLEHNTHSPSKGSNCNNNDIILNRTHPADHRSPERSEHPSFHYWENDFKKRSLPLNNNNNNSNSNPYLNNYYNPVQCTSHINATQQQETDNGNRPYITLNVKPQTEINPNKEGISLLLKHAYSERRRNFANLNYVNFSPSDFYYDTPHKEIVFEMNKDKNVSKDNYEYLYGNNKHAFEHSSLFYNLKERNKEHIDNSLELSGSGNTSCLQHEGKYTYNMSYNANPMRYAFKDNKGGLKKKSAKIKK